MKKQQMAMAAGVVILVLSACGQTESAEKERQEASDDQEMIPDLQEQTEGVSDAGNPLYEAFLKNEIGVANPYVEGMELTVMDDEGYESEIGRAHV